MPSEYAEYGLILSIGMLLFIELLIQGYSLGYGVKGYVLSVWLVLYLCSVTISLCLCSS